MALAVQNLRIEILGQIFYASFMVYNALPMGAGHTMFALASSLLNCIVVRLILAVVLEHFLASTASTSPAASPWPARCRWAGGSTAQSDG